MPYDPFQTQPQDTWNQFAANDYLRRQRALAGLDMPQLASPPPGMDTRYHNGPDFQDSWNHIAAAQNGAMRESDAMQPQADPRQMAAQMLYRKYSPHAPTYSNVYGQQSINGQPIQGDEASGQAQFRQAQQQAGGDFLNRMSGNTPATTQGRGLLQDPQFLGLDDPTKTALYAQTYGHPLSEDQQGDSLRAIDPNHLAQTAAQVRFRNTMPDRQKAEAGNLSALKSNYGHDPFLLYKNYDPTKGVSHMPGSWVMERDITGKQRPVQKPGADVPMQDWEIQHIGDLLAHQMGQERYPQPDYSQLPGMINRASNAYGVFDSQPQQVPPEARAAMGRVRGMASEAMGSFGAQHDPARIAQIMNTQHEINAHLQANGVNLTTQELNDAIRQASRASNPSLSFDGSAPNGGSKKPDLDMILSVARHMQAVKSQPTPFQQLSQRPILTPIF